MTSNTILNLQGINKSYQLGKNEVSVLTDVSASFDSGCFSVIAGPSGSGKSTLLNILGCLDTPNSGSYTLDGQTVDFSKKKQLSKLRMQNFGFVFQSFNLIPVLTARENVELPMQLHPYSRSEMKQLSEEILDLVGLGDKLNNKPAELSGGQQQRVAIARAMVTKPKMIFADEPTANLDRKTAEQVIQLMKELNEKHGISFVFASHDEALISQGHELLSIENGQLIAS